MFTRILVTIGLSTNTWSAMPYVRHLALKFGAELHLLGLSSQPQEVWDSSLTAYLDSISRNLQEENITSHTSFVYGNPAVEVAKYCSKNNIDLVATVAGTGNEISSPILSSISKRMDIRADIPVLMVPASRLKESYMTETVTIERILVPLDCTEVGEAILPYIAVIARKAGSSVTLLHVNSPPFRPTPVMHHEVVGMSRWVGREYLKKAVSQLQSRDVKASFEVVDGTPVKTILKHAHQNKSDLIAMGMRTDMGIVRWVFGNTANKVAERSTVPILTVSYPAAKLIEYPIPEYVSRIEGERTIPSFRSQISKS